MRWALSKRRSRPWKTSTGLVWAAVANKQPIRAIYKERPRLFCPHRLGRNPAGQFACSAIDTGGRASGLAPIGSPANWRCIVLENSAMQLLEGTWKTAPITLAPDNLRHRGRYGSGGTRPERNCQELEWIASYEFLQVRVVLFILEIGRVAENVAILKRRAKRNRLPHPVRRDRSRGRAGFPWPS